MSESQYLEQYLELAESNIITKAEFKILKANIKSVIRADKLLENGDTKLKFIKLELRAINRGFSEASELHEYLFPAESNTSKVTAVQLQKVANDSRNTEATAEEVEKWLTEDILSEYDAKPQTMEENMDKLLAAHKGDQPIDNYIKRMKSLGRWSEDLDEFVAWHKEMDTYYKPNTLKEIEKWIDDLYPEFAIKKTEEEYVYIKTRENRVLSNWECITNDLMDVPHVEQKCIDVTKDKIKDINKLFGCMKAQFGIYIVMTQDADADDICIHVWGEMGTLMRKASDESINTFMINSLESIRDTVDGFNGKGSNYTIR